MGIHDFDYVISYKSDDKFMVTLTWRSLPDVSEYRVKYRRTEDCLPNEHVIYTNQNKMTSMLITSKDISLIKTSTFVFTLRAYLLKTQKNDSFPKATSLMVDGKFFSCSKDLQNQDFLQETSIGGLVIKIVLQFFS